MLGFVGKSGKEHELVIEDEDLATAIKKCKAVSGRRLFQYVDGKKHYPLNAGDVNEYLGSSGTYDFTAKDFRTWGGTLKIYECITQELYDLMSRKKPLSQALETAAEALGNTAAVVRKSYVHPHLIEAIEQDELHQFTKKIKVERSLQYMSRSETELIELLKLLFKNRLKDLKSHISEKKS